MTDRKFYMTRVVATILSEEPLNPDWDLNDIHHAIREGNCSGSVTHEAEDELDGKQAAEALMEQGSDPEFFQLDEEGNDYDWYKDPSA